MPRMSKITMVQMKFITTCLMVIRLVESECEYRESEQFNYRVRETSYDCLSCIRFNSPSVTVSRYVCVVDGSNNLDTLLADLNKQIISEQNNLHQEPHQSYGWGQPYNSHSDSEFIHTARLTESWSVKVIFNQMLRANLSPANEHIPSVINKLLNLDCSGNRLSNIHPESFKEYISMIELNLADNQLSTISGEVFSSLVKLQKLNMSRNSFKSINATTFEHVPDLFIVDLSFNSISFLPPEVFSYQDHLELVDLKHNLINQFDVNFRIGVHSFLPSVDISFNNLETFDLSKEFNNVSLSHNKLMNVSLVVAPTVELLNLSYNTIKTVDQSSFLKASKLRILDISHNIISSMPTNSFKNAAHLEFLDISYNNFVTSTYDVNNNWISFFLNLKSLKIVHLEENHWKCTDLKDIIHTLKSRGIQIDGGNKHNATNVQGIHCHDVINNTQDFKFDSFESVQMLVDQKISNEITKLYLNFSIVQNNMSQIGQKIKSMMSKLDEINLNQNLTKTTNLGQRNKQLIGDLRKQIELTNEKQEGEQDQIFNSMNKLSFNYSVLQNNMTQINQQIKSIMSKLEGLILYENVTETPNLEERNKILIELKKQSELANSVPFFVKDKYAPTADIQKFDSTIKNVGDQSTGKTGVIVTNTCLVVLICCFIFFIYLYYKSKRFSASVIRENINLV